MCRLCYVFVLLFSSTFLYAQRADTVSGSSLKKELCLLTGVGYSKHAFIDLGVSSNRFGTIGHHPFASAFFASSELHFGSKIVIGPKVGAWASGGVGGIAMGVNMIYYSDFEKGSLVFKPEIGFGQSKFKLTYGYNARLTNTSFDRIPKNVVEATYCFRLKARGS